MDNKPKDKNEIIKDFGDDFGTLVKQNIAEIFVDIHASVSPMDPLNKD